MPTPTVETLLAEAVERPDPADRAAYLDRACGGDAAQRAEVSRLVDLHFRAGDFLEPPTPSGDETAAYARAARADDAVGTRVGPYTLLELLGAGGMGAVYVADQTEPVRRRVALKLIRPGMGSKEVVARFEQERQALALMDHPGIARVLDGGTAPDGRPYFVMELVRGLPITDYCDRARLTTRARLALFADVCRAVQHAHQKGVIHRDLKPSNVMVTLYDGRPVPKVIDFGIAKAVGATLAADPVYTRFAQLVGTPLYMSPEQAELSAQDIDTRSDVYSLGVLLYELLTGTTPFDAEAFRRAGFDGMRRIIREEEPPRPSARLSTLAAAARSTVSDRRGMDDRRLSRQLRGELDWIVMRALEKDRTRRYESAGLFAADIERFLANEPVTARPPSASYRTWKFAIRNRVALLTAGLVAAALVAGTAVSAYQAVLATDARHRAEVDRDRAVEAELRATAISEFLQRDMLRQVHRDRQIEGGFAPVADLTVREALDRAANQIGERFRDQPLVEAAIRRTIGEAYHHLDDRRSPTPHLERAVVLYRDKLGPDHPETLGAVYSLAMTYQWDRLPEAITLLEEVLDRRRAILGPDHPITLSTLNGLGEACRKAGQLTRARELLTLARERWMAVIGPEREGTLNSTHDLGLVYRDLGQLPEAASLLEGATRGLSAVLGTDHTDTRYARANLVTVYERMGRLDESCRHLRAAIRGARNDDSHNLTVLVQWWFHLSKNLLALGRHDEAEDATRHCLATYESMATGTVTWTTFETQSMLGGAFLGQKKYADAEPLLLKGYEGMKQREKTIPPRGKVRLPEALDRLIELYTTTNKPDEAKKWRAERAKYREIAPPPRPKGGS